MSEDQAENGEGDPRVEDPATRYIQYWEYLRHIERLRFQLASVVVVVTVVALGFVSDPNNVRHDDNRKWVLVGLAAFVFAALMYLVQHKASYRKYFNLVNALDPEDLINVKGLRDPFLWLLTLVSVLEVATVVILVDGFGRNWALLGVVFLSIPWLYYAVNGDKR